MRATRRELLAVAGGALAATAVGRLGGDGSASAAGSAFDGAVQAGILTPRQDHLTLAAFDFSSPDPADLARLLAAWTELVRTLPAGVAPARAARDAAPADSGEADGLGPRGLTITVGVGPRLFAAGGGYAGRGPRELRELPAFAGDERLDAARGGGDLLVQVCADDRQVAFHATHQLTGAALGIATPRWTQHGFVARPRRGATPRNLLGFEDGTSTIAASDAGALHEHVWVPPERGGHRRWLAGGSYLVYRRVRLRLTAWDRTTLAEQERTIGRRRASGAAFGARSEHEPVVLARTPAGSHVASAHPAANDGIQLLRRAYNFDDGVTGDGELDAGLVFVCFTRDPARFARVQARLDERDALSRYAIPTASAVFALPPAPSDAGAPLAQPLLLS